MIKGFLAAALAAVISMHAAAADIKFSALPLAASLNGTERIVAIQGAGCPTSAQPCSNVAITPVQIATYTSGAIAATYQPLDGDLTSLAGAASTNALYYRSAANTWTPVTIGGALTFAGGTLNVGTVPMAQGGTGGTTPATARAALGVKRTIPSGRYMLPEGVPVLSGSSTAIGTGTMRMFLGRVPDSGIINALAARVQTAAASGNVQFAVYAADPTTLNPTGAPLFASASGISTATAGGIADATPTLAVTPGYYWFALNADSNGATAVLTATSFGQAGIFGASGLSTLTSIAGLAKTQAYGSWPTMTGVLATDGLSDAATANVTAIFYKIS